MMQETGLLRLLDDEASGRRAAVDELADSAVSAYALRDVLLRDPDASVRARAAERLGAMSAWPPAAGARVPGAWLEEATADSHPSVREAALRSLARVRDVAAAPRLARMAAADPVWPVRRAAILALTATVVDAGADVAVDARMPALVATLLAALDDPFWRVRHAAIQALAAVCAADRATRDRVQKARPASPTAAWALEYLRRGLAGHALPPHEPAPRPEPVRRVDASVDPVWDPDPAVMTARLEDPDIEVSRALLLDVIADAHEPLRTAAARRLRACNDVRVYRAALAWLDEPRIPHAASAVRAILDDLGDAARELVIEVLEPGHQPVRGPGARTWALSWVARTRSRDLAGVVAAHVRDPEAEVRAAALAALAHMAAPAHMAAGSASATVSGAEPDPAAIIEMLARATSDPDDDVRLACVRGLASLHAGEASAALGRVPWADQPASVRRELVAAAAEHGDLERLRGAAQDPDAWCRALALSALDACGQLDADARDRARRDPDPWLRMAVLDQPGALAALGVADLPDAGDPDPRVRRAALAWLASRCHDAGVRARAALACAAAADPWLRGRACELLDPTRDADLQALLGLSADRVLLVRAAAADRLGACADLDRRLEQLLKAQTSDDVRMSAYTWLCRALDHDAGERLTGALATGAEPPRVAAHLRAMLAGCPNTDAAIDRAPAQGRGTARRARPDQAIADIAGVPRRPLGRTGMEVAPLAISGAFELPPAALIEARRAGVNLFFWEPRYPAMTRFLRTSPARRRDLIIATGTFHGSAAAIEADVDSALRKLRTDYLDLFLVFWVRSAARLSDPVSACLDRLVRQGKIRAAGFSTHDRALAADALRAKDWDVVMVRHSAAHRGAETEVFPVARERGAGVLTFSALCYGRMLRPVPGDRREAVPSAADCYRYSLSQDGVSACISAPRRYSELTHNLAVLAAPTLAPERVEALRRHGRLVHDRNRDFNALIRREPEGPGQGATRADSVAALLHEVAPDPHF